MRHHKLDASLDACELLFNYTTLFRLCKDGKLDNFDYIYLLIRWKLQKNQKNLDKFKKCVDKVTLDCYNIQVRPKGHEK